MLLAHSINVLCECSTTESTSGETGRTNSINLRVFSCILLEFSEKLFPAVMLISSHVSGLATAPSYLGNSLKHTWYHQPDLWQSQRLHLKKPRWCSLWQRITLQIWVRFWITDKMSNAACQDHTDLAVATLVNTAWTEMRQTSDGTKCAQTLPPFCPCRQRHRACSRKPPDWRRQVVAPEETGYSVLCFFVAVVYYLSCYSMADAKSCSFILYNYTAKHSALTKELSRSWLH